MLAAAQMTRSCTSFRLVLASEWAGAAARLWDRSTIIGGWVGGCCLCVLQAAVRHLFGLPQHSSAYSVYLNGDGSLMPNEAAEKEAAQVLKPYFPYLLDLLEHVRTGDQVLTCNQTDDAVAIILH